MGGLLGADSEGVRKVSLTPLIQNFIFIESFAYI